MEHTLPPVVLPSGPTDDALVTNAPIPTDLQVSILQQHVQLRREIEADVRRLFLLVSHVSQLVDEGVCSFANQPGRNAAFVLDQGVIAAKCMLALIPAYPDWCDAEADVWTQDEFGDPSHLS